MDIYRVVLAWLGLDGPSETDEQYERRMKDWYEHLWATM